jgi:hypothetical protein
VKRLYLILVLGFFIPLSAMEIQVVELSLDSSKTSKTNSEQSDSESPNATSEESSSSDSSDWAHEPKLEPVIIPHLPDSLPTADKQSGRSSPKKLPSMELLFRSSLDKLNAKQVTPEASFFVQKDQEGRFVTIDNFIYSLDFWKHTESTAMLTTTFYQVPIETLNEFIKNHQEVFSEYIGIKDATKPRQQLLAQDIQKVRELAWHMLLISGNNKIELQKIESQKVKETLLKKYLKIRCFLLSSVSLTLGWALAATCVALLKNSC